MRILIVEDNADNAALLCRLLLKYGHRCEVATNLALAIAAAGHSDFDVALIDLNLSDGNGEALVPLFAEKGIRCIAVTGDHHAPALGQFSAYLTKPINFSDLAVLLNQVQ